MNEIVLNLNCAQYFFVSNAITSSFSYEVCAHADCFSNNVTRRTGYFMTSK